MRLGEMLVEAGRTTTARVSEALEEQRGMKAPLRLGELLVRNGAVSEEEVLQALGRQFRADVLSEVGDELLDPELVRDLPVEWARARLMLPIRYRGAAAVLTADPTRVREQEELSLLLGCELAPVLAGAEAVRGAISRCYFRRGGKEDEYLGSLSEGARDGEPEEGPAEEADDLLRTPGEAPVTRLVNMILLEAVRRGASDVHIEPFENRLLVRSRVDGLLYEQATPPRRFESALVSRLKVMGRLDIAERRLPQDGMARVRVGDREIDIRVSTIPVASGERVVLRLLHRESALLPLSELGMPADMAAAFGALLTESSGAVWVTGPTGSGKTTTLYAALRELDTAHRNVLTIEDPVEYQLPGIGQMAVKPKIGLTFARGLRHLLRQDPDVILVGETRDLETAEIAVRASLTGHLVFSTLHTNDAPGAMVRLTDMGIPGYLAAAASRAVLAQRLARVLCEACKRPASPGSPLPSALGAFAARLEGATLFEAAGCEQCLGGYRGRVGLYELMLLDEPLKEAVRAETHPARLRTLARQRGMIPLFEEGLELVRRGRLDLDELFRAAGHPEAPADPV